MTSEGEMQEWLNWTVSKTVVAQVTVGSNPTLSVFLFKVRSKIVGTKRLFLLLVGQ